MSFIKEDVANLEKTREILKYGVPDRGPAIRSYSDHVLAYDQAKKTPIWVAEHLHRGKLTGSANRKKSQFQPDLDVESMFSSTNDDYRHSGWSRGHMAPAGNYKFDQRAMSDTFYLTNILPQDPDNNAGFWNRFEMYCRDLTKKFKDVRILSGPVMLPESEEDGKLYVNYEVIGKNQVAVPTHLFKVIVAENDDSDKKYVGAFVVPNKPISSHKLQDFEVSVDYLERKTGVKYLPKLDKSRQSSLCGKHGCAIMSSSEFELDMTRKRIERAYSVHQLEKAWTELQNKRVQPDEKLVALYQNRRNELVEKEKLKREL
ncbi:nuclease EXOG, mitochondrial-like isoform X2 [Haliotis rubra]|uniref:nuclease EXOG, mitochondrial-like isoform X2 n=1 Tax=Haliotis rubra TaxID=36100 RepID=UPI001EE549D2|nr:nuclease EXOG, mitochondrial-like isoform X2 [Haliotis rubra]